MAATAQPTAGQTRLEAYTETSALLMIATLREVNQLREATRHSGALALESMLGVPIIGGTPELDRVTHTTATALSFAARAGAEALHEHGELDERTVAQVERERHPVVTNGMGSIAIMGKIRRVMAPVFSRENHGREITGPEHVALARNSFGIPRKLASQHFPVMEAIIKYLHFGPIMRGNEINPAKLTIADRAHGQALTFANRAELARVIQQEKERLDPVNGGRSVKGRCPALSIGLAEATWGLMIDIQEAGLAVRPRDRLRYAGGLAVKRLGLRAKAAS